MSYTYNPSDFTAYRPQNTPKPARRDGIYCLTSNYRSELYKEYPSTRTLLELGEKGEYFLITDHDTGKPILIPSNKDITYVWYFQYDEKSLRGERNLIKLYFETEHEANKKWQTIIRNPTPIIQRVIYDTVYDTPVSAVDTASGTCETLYWQDNNRFEMYKFDLGI